MAIKVTKGSESFRVESRSSGILGAAAETMAELQKRWGYRGTPSKLDEEFQKIIATASLDSKVKAEELRALKAQSAKIQLLEELAVNFRESFDEASAEKPRFLTDEPEALNTVRDYASSLGAKLEIVP